MTEFHAHNLTVKLSGIDGQGVPNVKMDVSLVDPSLLALPSVPTQTLFPKGTSFVTDKDGIAVVPLLPSEIVGSAYRIQIADFTRIVEMPAENVRLSALEDVQADDL